MSTARAFAYCRVSTVDQTTDNQAREIAAAGFTIEPQRLIAETVSGSTAAMQRKGFARLVDRLEAGDVLIVTKLDRLGRNAMDVRATVDMLESQEGARPLPRPRRHGPHQRGGKDDDGGHRGRGRV